MITRRLSESDSASPRQTAAMQSAIRSPMKGTVKRLLVNTVGGVVQPGKDIVEIVPTEDRLVLEARIQPRDIGFLRPGQKAMVKFTAYDFAIYGGLEGTLDHIGADSITDERGNTFYIVRVLTTPGMTMKDAAGELGMSRATIYRKVTQYDIHIPKS